MPLDNSTKRVPATENGTSLSDQTVITKNKPRKSKSNARKSIRTSLSTPSSRITQSINPLHIPEIRAEIGRYLKRSALARCALVCRDWNKTFSRQLYSNVEITRKLRSNPSPEVLHHNSSLIKSLTILTDRLDRSYSDLVLPNLQSLTLHLKVTYLSVSNGPTAIIRNNTNIRKIELKEVITDSQITFWKVVSKLPHLEELIVVDEIVAGGPWGNRVHKDKEINAFWNSCSRVKKLALIKFDFINKSPFLDKSECMEMPASTIARTLSDRTFPLIQDLTISKCDFHLSNQFMLVMKCPNLECLEWRDLEYMFTTHYIDMTTPIQDFSQNLASGEWPSLKSLAIRFAVQDGAFAELIRSFGDRTLERLDVSTTRFGEQAFGELRHYFPTLQALDICDCPNLTSINVMEVLISCTNLQSLRVGRIYAQYLDTDQIWPCSKTLQSLSIEFELDREPNTSESSGATERTPEELNEVVFACLGQLPELESLTVGYPEPELCYGQTYVRASISLEIRLSKGLARLAGLKKLRHFAMGDLTSSLGAAEVDWMMDNWRHLEVIEGLSEVTRKIPRQVAVKRRGIMVK
ncbi:hypothetical protein BGX20_006586 [Mortierella sp. AD010]|nr:hypothetical protein BGX20_006586 [Mortierella sp. AD010]